MTSELQAKQKGRKEHRCGARPLSTGAERSIHSTGSLKSTDLGIELCSEDCRDPRRLRHRVSTSGLTLQGEGFERSLGTYGIHVEDQHGPDSAMFYLSGRQ